MNHEKECSKAADLGCEVRHIKAFSDIGPFMSEAALKQIAKVPHQLMIVSGRHEKSLIKAVEVTVGPDNRHFMADKVTGSLYSIETGRCLSSSFRRLEGLAPDGYTLPEKGASDFCYGTQPITNSPKAAPKKRRKPLKQDVERNAAGKVCGSSKHSAKVDEDAVRAIRAHKPGTTDIYVMTAKQAAARLGISENTVSDIRRRRTWGHVE